ncbi:MAG: hypothetical protein LBQ73_02705 [Tannerellaceae bacterium]|jgi:hypothetical protein|nr:hypothetical protein [Tannerellaceae bacterium]
MTNKEKIDGLLSDISELEGLVAGMREMEICPLAFFSQTFDLAYKIIRDLHVLEGLQIDVFQKQMEEYQKIIETTLLLQEASGMEASKSGAPEVTAAPPPVVAEPDPVLAPPPAEKQPISLNDALEKKNLSDFRKALSLNERFYFRKELFGGDEAKMNKVIADLNDIHSYGESVKYLHDKQNWDVNSAPAAEFLTLLEKRFR